MRLNTFAPTAVVGVLLWAAAAGAADLSVMSFNIRYGTANDGENHWDRRKELVYDVIRSRTPEVVGLQEALRFQIDEIRAALPQYGELGEGRDGGAEGEYSAILYRKDRLQVKDSGNFWLSQTPEKPSMHWGNACIRMCTWARFTNLDGDHPFYVYNTHLDHVSQPSREKGAALILDRIRARPSPDPFVVTGDFNAGEANPAVRRLVSAGRNGGTEPPMRDSFRVLFPQAREVGTFNGFAGRTGGDKIDYVFVSPGIEVLEASIIRDQVEDVYPSDHFPVSAKIRLPANPG